MLLRRHDFVYINIMAESTVPRNDLQQGGNEPSVTETKDNDCAEKVKMIPAEYAEERIIEELKNAGYEGKELEDIIEDMDVDFEEEEEVLEEGFCDSDRVWGGILNP